MAKTSAPPSGRSGGAQAVMTPEGDCGAGTPHKHMTAPPVPCLPGHSRRLEDFASFDETPRAVGPPADDDDASGVGPELLQRTPCQVLIINGDHHQVPDNIGQSLPFELQVVAVIKGWPDGLPGRIQGRLGARNVHRIRER
ncbi:hypothetical protein [Bosea sp. 2RAB26]|uniref:hypothetical protein n=1 Tax=Bosea sp. 2RAB26 TaxID=3237476 RepID=UPI003F903212